MEDIELIEKSEEEIGLIKWLSVSSNNNQLIPSWKNSYNPDSDLRLK